MTHIEKMKEWIEAMEKSLPRLAPYGEQDWLDSKAAIASLRQAIAEAEKQEPVAWQVMVEDEAMKEFPIKDMAHDWCLHQKLSGSPHSYWIRPLYTTPPQRTEQEPQSVRERWNIERDGDDLLVCFNGHDKSQACTYTRYVPAPQRTEQEQEQSFPSAMQTVIKAIKSDPDYAWVWHFNIAMAFVDAGGDSYTGNQGAARFMKLLANVEPAYELPAQPEQEPVIDKSAAIRIATALGWEPKREWVGLTDDERKEIWKGCDPTHAGYVTALVEDKLKQKNGYAEENT